MCIVAAVAVACGGDQAGPTPPGQVAPTVTTVSPGDGATGVPVTTPVLASFSTEMDAASLTTGTMAIMGGAGVTGSITYANRTATFTPSTPLAYATTYTASVTTGARSAAGVRLAAGRSWTFTTELPPPGTTPTVTAVTPPNGATGVAVSSPITATFSIAMDPVTLTASTMTVSGGVTGTVAVANLVATFTPSAPLAGGTSYTVTITTGARSTGGTPLAASYTWSFTTAATPVGPINFPLAVGKRWLYDDTSRGSACTSSGCSSVVFSGSSVLVVDSQLALGGAQASRVRRFRIGNDATFQVSTLYLSQAGGGLDLYDVTGASWRTVLPASGTSFAAGAFILAGGPLHAANNVLTSESETVPAGTYAVVASRHAFTQTGPFAPADIFENEKESYADGVGVVLATQSYSYDDNNPSGIDQSAYRRVELRGIDTFAIPALVAETEPNDSSSTALPALVQRSIVTASILMGDGGSVDSGTTIGRDSLGVRKVQDWYRVVPARSDTLYIRLETEATGQDLDLYLVRSLRGSVTVIASSTRRGTSSETITVPVTGGLDYYIAVQAWFTGTRRVGYWMFVR